MSTFARLTILNDLEQVFLFFLRFPLIKNRCFRCFDILTILKSMRLLSTVFRCFSLFSVVLVVVLRFPPARIANKAALSAAFLPEVLAVFPVCACAREYSGAAFLFQLLRKKEKAVNRC